MDFVITGIHNDSKAGIQGPSGPNWAEKFKVSEKSPGPIRHFLFLLVPGPVLGFAGSVGFGPWIPN